MRWRMILNKDALDQITADLGNEEGLRLQVYKDSRGNDTWGYGFLLANGWDKEECDFILAHRLQKYEAQLAAAFPKYYELDSIRQCVLLDMAWNMGVPGLMEFKNMLADILRRDYGAAADEIMQSESAQQHPGRNQLWANRMRTGLHE